MIIQQPLMRMQRLVAWLGLAPATINSPNSHLDLFGGSSPWITSQVNWTAVDDRVRGGSSQSFLERIENDRFVRFYGNLDTKTLGGAGFASQTTTGNTTWDLSGYNGLELEIAKADNMTYTFIFKDEVPDEKRDDGREKSSVNWEYDFKVENGTACEVASTRTSKIQIPWGDFKATYRGREKKDAPPLKTGEIRRFSLMTRSFFDQQDGKFELELKRISAYKSSSNEGEEGASGI